MTETGLDAADLDAFDAVVYDLDGTLVRLAVDWEAVARDAVDLFAEEGVEIEEADLWAMLDLAEEHDLRERLEAVIAAHEREGARRSDRLPLAERLPDHGVPLGVCSLNAEDACREALATHDLAPHVRTVVGRDSVERRKPDPEPLLATLRELGVDPGDAVFVGDSARDEEAARRAGVAFRYVDGAPSDR
ncbi:MAG: HAD family hydrolase [Salinigranum sp.]